MRRRGKFGWDELIELHLARQAVERGLSRNSLEAYGGDLRDFQNFCRERSVEPRALDAAAILGYLEDLATREFRVTSQRRRLAAVRGLIREMIERKTLDRDPATAVKLRPHPRPLPRTLGRADTAALIEAIDTGTLRGKRDRAMLELAYGCGLARLGTGRAQAQPGESRGARVDRNRQGRQGADHSGGRRGAARVEVAIWSRGKRRRWKRRRTDARQASPRAEPSRCARTRRYLSRGWDAR